MSAVEDWAATAAVLAAGAAGVFYLLRALWRGLQSLLLVHDLIKDQLSPNHGGSMRDQVAAIARAVGQLQAQVGELAASKEADHTALRNEMASLTTELQRQPDTEREDEEDEKDT